MKSEKIRHYLGRIDASQTFARSQRARDLLIYVVEAALEGKASQLNGTVLAQDVFGKGGDFDAATDPIVRVQMGRLRRLLSDYYQNEGREDAIVITIPKGANVPRFDEREDDPEITAPVVAPAIGWRGFAEHRLLMGGALALVATVFLGILLAAGGRDEAVEGSAGGYPRLVVLPFENLTGNDADDLFRTGFQRQLASDLQRFKNVRVYLRNDASALQEVDADYALIGTLLETEPQVDFLLQLVDVKTDEVVTSERIERRLDGDDYFELLRNISQRVVGRLAGPSGALEDQELAKLRQRMGVPGVTNLENFRCLSLFHNFTAVKTDQKLARVQSCLDERLAEEPRDASLWAAKAWVTALSAPEAHQMTVPGSEATLPQALRYAERAVALDPGNDFAHQHLGLIQWANGQQRGAIGSFRRAVDLNPANPEHLADLALFLALTGRWEEAETYYQLAIARSAMPPAWFHMPMFYQALVEGDGARALAIISRMEGSGDPYIPAYKLAAAVLAQEATLIEKWRPQVVERAARHGGDPYHGLNVWLGDSPVLDTIKTLLAEVGITGQPANPS
jgi:TolB-like protein